MLLVPSTDTRLREKCVPFDFGNPPFEAVAFAHELVRTMHEHQGLGLSANQVGFNVRIFAMRGHPENFVCINPKIVYTGEEHIVLEEGCLSFPGLLVKVKRPRHIRVRFNTPNGDIKTMRFDGMTARVFQHEFDHLEGVLFFNKANRYHRDQGFKKMAQWQRQREMDKVKKEDTDFTLQIPEITL